MEMANGIGIDIGNLPLSIGSRGWTKSSTSDCKLRRRGQLSHRVHRASLSRNRGRGPRLETAGGLVDLTDHARGLGKLGGKRGRGIDTHCSNL